MTDQYSRSINGIEVDDGGFAFVGATTNEIGNKDLYVLKVDNNLNQEWSYTPNENFQLGIDIIQNSAGELVVTSAGYDDYEDPSYYRFTLFSSSGNLIKENKIYNPDHKAVSPLIHQVDTGYLVRAHSINGISKFIKLNNDLEAEWENDFTANSYYTSIDFIKLTDGNCIAAFCNPNDEDKIGLCKVDGSGEMIWENSLWSTQEFFGGCIAEASDNGLIIGVTSGFSEITLIKLDENGGI